ncbi:hypothetical protein [Tateyamaria sp. SN6-1]|uniref:hypothetical protein n=1 Tax=Tateyamaria sp. SN6-1 TaxID=3092148 RepID=UPI0039F63DF8
MLRVLALGVSVFVSGCALVDQVRNPGGAPEPVVSDTPDTDVTTGDVVRPEARPDDAAVDAPAAPDVSIGTLGRTVASLGNAAEPGLWIKTPLVQSQRPGTVYYPETNKSVKVTLIPIDGPATAGSRLSLQAMQELGAPLTGLPEVDVLAG